MTIIDPNRSCLREFCRQASEEYKLKRNGKPTAKARKARLLREFYGIHRGSFSNAVDDAIREHFCTNLMVNRITFDWSNHFTHFRLVRRPDYGGNPSITFCIETGKLFL